MEKLFDSNKKYSVSYEYYDEYYNKIQYGYVGRYGGCDGSSFHKILENLMGNDCLIANIYEVEGYFVDDGYHDLGQDRIKRTFTITELDEVVQTYIDSLKRKIKYDTDVDILMECEDLVNVALCEFINTMESFGINFEDWVIAEVMTVFENLVVDVFERSVD